MSKIGEFLLGFIFLIGIFTILFLLTKAMITQIRENLTGSIITFLISNYI
jgi:hypothetical protein